MIFQSNRNGNRNHELGIRMVVFKIARLDEELDNRYTTDSVSTGVK
jgi:hypothetical protein